METQEQFTRLWTEAQPKLAGYLNALVPDFAEAEDLLQNVAVILLRKFLSMIRAAHLSVGQLASRSMRF